jgi:uncharacterized protein (TIGR02246 family)
MKCAIVLMLALTLSPSALFAQSNAQQAAHDMFARFLSTMTNADVPTVTSLFTEDALFWGTGSKSLVTDPAGVLAYFTPVGNNTPGQTLCRALDYSVEVISDDLALLSGMWEVVPPGQESRTLRLSMAVARHNDEWKIIQFHNSAVPQ